LNSQATPTNLWHSSSEENKATVLALCAALDDD
jgi:hypothetical protein